MLIVLLIGTAGLLDISNAATDELLMHGTIIKMDGQRKVYERRLDLARELVQESGCSAWAIKPGMMNEKDLEEHQERPNTIDDQNTTSAGASGSTTAQADIKAPTQMVNQESESESNNPKPSSPAVERVTM
jgi:hypothetical protein